MKNTFKKFLAFLVILTVITGFIPNNIVVKADTDYGKVRVVVENTTYSVETGAAWEGTLLDTEVELNGQSTMLSAIEDAVTANGFTIQILSGSYINEINGIASGMADSWSGFTGTLNDWFTNDYFGAYSVENGKLKDGDEIRVMHTVTFTDLENYDYMNTSTLLSKVVFSKGALDKEFSGNETEYTLTVPSDTSSIVVVPTAAYKGYQVRTYLNVYEPTDDTADYSRTKEIPVSDGSIIYIGVGDENWPGSYEEKTVYEFKVKVEEKEDIAETDIYNEVASKYLADAETTAAYGSEWRIINLARGNAITNEVKEDYVKSVEATVAEIGSAKLSSTRATENARVILGLASVGVDATDISGYNLLEPLADIEFITNQGINAVVYALLAFDSNDYEVPTVEGVDDVSSRERLIKLILDYQAEDGAFTWDGSYEDNDITAMAIQALAPYYESNEDVKAAVDKAVVYLSENQLADGSFDNWGSNCETTAQVIIALCAININPATDERFVKNGESAILALKGFYLGNGEFSHTLSGAADVYATEQGELALAAYLRLTDNKSALFDMKDAFAKADDNNESNENKDEKVDSDDKTTVAKDEATGEKETTIKAEKEAAPKTGDLANPFAILLIMMSAAVVVAINSKKENN